MVLCLWLVIKKSVVGSVVIHKFGTKLEIHKVSIRVKLSIAPYMLDKLWGMNKISFHELVTRIRRFPELLLHTAQTLAVV